ncbi:hypothetical protein GCM10027610_131100 [Dactylosporangium cerinum]
MRAGATVPGMFGFGRKPGAKAVTARGEIAHVAFGLQSVDREGHTRAASYTVGVQVFPDGAAPFLASIKVKLRGTAGPMIGEETWVRYRPDDRQRIDFDRDRIKVRAYDRVRANPRLKIVVDTLYTHGDPPVSVIATAR